MDFDIHLVILPMSEEKLSIEGFVWDQLKKGLDPELGVSIVDLGLI